MAGLEQERIHTPFSGQPSMPSISAQKNESAREVLPNEDRDFNTFFERVNKRIQLKGVEWPLRNSSVIYDFSYVFGLHESEVSNLIAVVKQYKVIALGDPPKVDGGGEHFTADQVRALSGVAWAYKQELFFCGACIEDVFKIAANGREVLGDSKAAALIKNPSEKPVPNYGEMAAKYSGPAWFRLTFNEAYPGAREISFRRARQTVKRKF